MRGRLGGLAIALCVGCTQRADPTLNLVSVSPAQANGAAQVELVVRGEGLVPQVRSDFGDRTRGTIDAAFTLRVGEVDLEQVRLMADGTLQGVLPPGLARGGYDVTVVTPSGASAVLPQAFRIVSAAENVSRFRFDPIGPKRAGVPFVIGITAVDDSDRVVDGYSGMLTLSDGTGTLAPVEVGPLELGRLRGARVTVSRAIDQNALVARDTLGHEGRSDAFEVRSGLPVALEFVSSRQQLVAGACSDPVVVESRDFRGIATPVESEVLLQLSAGPAFGVSFHADAACAAPAAGLRLSPGTSRQQFFFRADQAGALTLRVNSAFPTAEQEQAVRAAGLTRLRFVTPSQVLKVGACSAPAAVGGADAFGNPAPPGGDLVLSLRGVPDGGLPLYSDATCTVALASGLLPSDGGTVGFYFRGLSPGRAAVWAGAADAGLAEVHQPHTVEP